MAILLEHSAAASFDAYVNSPAFLRGVIDTFGPQLLQSNPGAPRVDARRLFVPPRVARRDGEPRAGLLPEGSPRRSFTADVDPHRAPHDLVVPGAAVPVSRQGPHRDRENRIFSMVLFFNDADAAEWAGGEFVMLSGTDAARKRARRRRTGPSPTTPCSSSTVSARSTASTTSPAARRCTRGRRTSGGG